MGTEMRISEQKIGSSGYDISEQGLTSVGIWEFRQTLVCGRTKSVIFVLFCVGQTCVVCLRRKVSFSIKDYLIA
jgi:hypothetical protein